MSKFFFFFLKTRSVNEVYFDFLTFPGYESLICEQIHNCDSQHRKCTLLMFGVDKVPGVRDTL